MKIILSDHLPFLDRYWKSKQTNDCEDILEAIISGDDSIEWSDLRSSAHFIADEVVHFKPLNHTLYKNSIDPPYRSKALGLLNKNSPDRTLLDNLESVSIDQSYDQLNLQPDLLNTIKLYIDAIRTEDERYKDGLFLSPDPVINKLRINSDDSMNNDNVLLILAMSGIQIYMPYIYCDNLDKVLEVKEKLGEEREKYLNTMRSFICDCKEKINSGTYSDIYAYAESVTNNKIKQAVIEIEIAAKKLNKELSENMLKRAAQSVPTIATSLMDSEKKLTNTVVTELLKVLCTSLFEKKSIQQLKDKNRLGSYIYTLKNMD